MPPEDPKKKRSWGKQGIEGKKPGKGATDFGQSFNFSLIWQEDA